MPFLCSIAGMPFVCNFHRFPAFKASPGQCRSITNKASSRPCPETSQQISSPRPAPLRHSNFTRSFPPSISMGWPPFLFNETSLRFVIPQDRFRKSGDQAGEENEFRKTRSNAICAFVLSSVSLRRCVIDYCQT